MKMPLESKPLSQLKIRRAGVQDAEYIEKLLWQLGQPQPKEVIIERIQLYTTHPNYNLIIAEIEEKLVGFVALSLAETFVTDYKKCRNEAMIIDQQCKNMGIESNLIKAAEQFAKDRGCKLIELTSA